MLQKRDADVKGATFHQVELQRIARLQQKQAKLDGSGFKGRYADILRHQAPTFSSLYALQQSSLWLPWQKSMVLQQAQCWPFEQHSARHAQTKAWHVCRWRGGAEGLVLYIAASMVVAYEQLKQIPGKEAIAQWKDCNAHVRGSRSDYLRLAETDDQMLARWERTTMLEVFSPLAACTHRLLGR